MSLNSISQREIAMHLFRQKELVCMRELRNAGVAGETVSRLVRDGTVERLARGLYQRTGALPDVWRSQAEASAQVPKGVICLTSALEFHELTHQLPTFIWMAIDRTVRKPKVEYPPIRFVRFGGLNLTRGVERHLVDGIEVPIYEPAKTIVDCFRYRNKIGLDIALEGLREGLISRRVLPDQLWEFASTARVWSVMEPYIQAMLTEDTFNN